MAFTGDNYFLQEVLVSGKVEVRPYQTTVLRNSFQLGMHRRCIEVMNRVAPDLICPGHLGVWKCDPSLLREYSDFIHRKERVFRKLVAQPSDRYIDLFWARMLPYLARVKAGESLEYRLLLRNNLETEATFQARLMPPEGWSAGGEFAELTLPAEGKGEIRLAATAPAAADGVRRLMTAEIAVDGVSQGPLAEALVTVED